MCNQFGVCSLCTRNPFATVFGSSKNTFCATKKPDDRHSAKTMHTKLQRNFYLPLQLKHLLIADFTQNQQIPVNWNGVPLDIEILISYNACHNRVTRDSFQIEYGQHMTAKRCLWLHRMLLTLVDRW